MKYILETERLILRELNENDAINFYELNLNPNVIKYTGDRAFINIQEAKEFLKNYKDYKKNGFGRWAVISKQDKIFLGWCGLKYDDKCNETDIGFRFFEKYWNNGYATESAKACLDFGFKNLSQSKIVGRAMKQNIASIKVLEKIGLTYERDFDFEGSEGSIYIIEK